MSGTKLRLSCCQKTTLKSLTLILPAVALVQGVFRRVVRDRELVQQGGDHLNNTNTRAKNSNHEQMNRQSY